MEFREPDSTRRAQLAEIKHLANHLRRQDERLLIVVDDESARRAGQETGKLHEILTAQAEPRPYRRIEFPPPDRDVDITEPAVYDVGLVVGELLDNAIAFAPPREAITVEARRRAGGVTILINDAGIGIKPEHLERLNQRLTHPPIVDAEVLR